MRDDTNPWPSISVIRDPVAKRRGKVARMKYSDAAKPPSRVFYLMADVKDKGDTDFHNVKGTIGPRGGVTFYRDGKRVRDTKQIRKLKRIFGLHLIGRKNGANYFGKRPLSARAL